MREIDAIGAETRWDYDQAGNLIRLTDANGHATTFTYDAEGRLASETRPDGKGWTRAYDCAGNEISLTTPSGIALGRTYDPEGRLTGRTVTGGMLPRALAESVSYDLLGRAVRKTATGGSSDVETRFVFDSLDRLITETTKIGAGPDRSVARSFDLAGNVTRLTYPSGRAFLFGFDPLDRMRTVSSQAGAGSVPVAAYDDVGRRQIKKTLGNGLVETRTYGVEPWLKTIDVRTPAGTAPTLGLDYGQRSPAGYKLDVIRSDRGRRNHYVYDLAGRITTEQLGLLEPPPAPPAANIPDVEDRYTLDPVLNITKRERTAAGTTVTTVGVADARNRTTKWGSETPAWDADGNLTGYKGMSLSYGMDSRLTKATFPNGDSLEILYDADGRKVRETTTSGTAKAEKDVVQAGNQIVETYPKDGTTPTAVYVHGRGIDEAVEAELDPTAGGTTTHVVPLQDELGNVSYLTDQNGQVLERYDYEGYGKFRIFDPAGVPLTTSAYGWNRHFQGREYIPMLDAYDFRARTLWPELGRFGQEDPAGTVDSTNRYQALGGRWNGVTDPTGKYELDVHFYAIYFLTRAAGFGVPAARRIAWASQYVDNSPEGKPAPESATDARGARNALAEQERIGALHFAGPFGQVVVENNVYGRGGVRLAARRKDLTRLGVALHTFADSFSHAGFIMKWDKRNERTDSYRPDVGHADAPEGGHAPDRPYLEVAKAMRMASGALKMLQEAYMLYSGRPAPAIDGAMLEQDLGRAFSYTDSDEHTRAAYWKGLISLRLGDAPHYDPGTSPITSDAWSRAISDHVRAIKDLTEGRMNPYSLLPPDELRQEW